MTPLKNKKRGFTLIELLTVIAIIGVLTGILIPVVGSAIKSANKAKTKTQFNQYALALQQYKTQYGYWPKIASNALNTGEDGQIDLSSASTEFIQSLTARNPDGSSLSTAERNTYNRKATSFLSISDSELDPSDNTQIVDAFENPNIIIVVDSDNNGQIAGLPNRSTPLTAQIAIYSDTTSYAEGEDVYSWD